MKLFFYFQDLSGTGPVWLNVFWAHLRAFSESVTVEQLVAPATIPGASKSLAGRVSRYRQARDHGPKLCEQVRRSLDPNGPNILIVYALNGEDIRRSALLHPVWSAFDFTILSITDACFPDETKQKHLSRFDRIACFCKDMGDMFEAMSGVRSIYWPAHTDVLNHHSASEFRPIDLLLVGRRDQGMVAPLHDHFNTPGRDRLFLDFVTRTQGTPSVRDEFRLLMSTHQKAAASLCFEASDRGRYRGCSPLMGRWVHGWSSGCTILGRRPAGTAVREQMDWPESALDLPETPADAIAFVEQVLSDPVGLARRRRRNVIEALRRHDTRYRLRDLLTDLGVQVPDSLVAGLDSLANCATAVSET
ncbi:MAG: hypothetical protein AAF503_00190 [Pseudomonadota bacterium]